MALSITHKLIQTQAYSLREGRVDKVYHLDLIQDQQYRSPDYGFYVQARYGRRGSTLAAKRWPDVLPMKESDARQLYQQKHAERLTRGYQQDGSRPVADPAAATAKLPQHQLLNEITDPGPYISAPAERWWMQAKEDGVRAYLIVESGNVRAESRTRLPVSVDEAVWRAVLALKIDVVLDGEMCGDVYHAFDVIRFTDARTKEVHDLCARPYGARYDALKMIVRDPTGSLRCVRTWQQPKDKAAGYEVLKSEGAEGCVFKDPAAAYQCGRPNSGGSALKHKFWATATVAVVAKIKDDGKRSVDVAVCGGPGSTGPGSLRFLRANNPALWCSRIGSVTIPPNKTVPAVHCLIDVRYLYCVSSLVQTVYIGPSIDKIIPDSYSSLQFKAVDGEPATAPPPAVVMRRCDTCGHSVPLGADNKLLAHYAIHTLVCPSVAWSMNPQFAIDDNGNEVQAQARSARLVNPPAPEPEDGHPTARITAGAPRVEVIAETGNTRGVSAEATADALEEYWSGSISAQVAKPLCLCGHTELRHRKKGPAGHGYCLDCVCECYELEDEQDDKEPPEAVSGDPQLYVVSPELYRMIREAYSADRISDDKAIRKPFEHNGELYTAVSVSDEWSQAYPLIPSEQFEDYGDEQPGYYHGKVVTYARKSYVMCGPGVRFEPAAEANDRHITTVAAVAETVQPAGPQADRDRHITTVAAVSEAPAPSTGGWLQESLF